MDTALNIPDFKFRKKHSNYWLKYQGVQVVGISRVKVFIQTYNLTHYEFN